MLRQVSDGRRLLHVVRQQDDRLQQPLERLGAAIRGGQIEESARAVQQPVEIRRCVTELLAIALRTVPAAIFIGIHSAGQFQHAHVHAIAKQHFHRTLGCGLACRVGVEIDHDGVAMASEQTDLPRCERSAAGRDSIANACVPDPDHIHVALDEHCQIALAHRGACAMDVVQHRVLAVNRRFGRIQVLGLPVRLQAPPAVADQISAIGVDGKHEPVAKARVNRTILLGLAHQARLQNVRPLELLALEKAHQCIAAWRVAQAEFLDLFGTESSLLEIGRGSGAPVGLELLYEEPLRKLVDLQQALPHPRRCVGSGTATLLRQLLALLLG